jgi:hypothetical protein
LLSPSSTDTSITNIDPSGLTYNSLNFMEL